MKHPYFKQNIADSESIFIRLNFVATLTLISDF